MYKAYDRPAAIRQIQIYLDKLRQNGSYIAPSGVFDSTTREAVIDFQRRNDLSQTGIIDKDTFDLLYLEYQSSELKKFPTLNKGDFSERILFLNRVIYALSIHYGITRNLTVNNYYSDTADRILRDLSNIYLVNYDGRVEKEFYDRLIRDYNSLSNGE